MECRLIHDGPRPGIENMAIDETLLGDAVSGKATLRFYEWLRPTVSVGHFQSSDAALLPEPLSRLEVVRRLSGGGAIVHDRELTYSCSLPAAHPISGTPSQLYDIVHQVIIEVLQEFGVNSRLRGDDAFAAKPFLCFARGDARDIVIGAHKIVGSAQRRRQGAVLQHGSILLQTSEFAPEFLGISELTGSNAVVNELIPRLEAGILQKLNLVRSSESSRSTD